MPDIEIVALDRAEIVVEPWSWPFAADRRDEIDRYFARLQRERSGVWNGRALLLNRYAIGDARTARRLFRDRLCQPSAPGAIGIFPIASVYNIFAAAALQAADGAYLVGEMAPDTAPAGALYFPCGTPEPDDIDAGGALDLAGNLRRELREETGIDIGELAAEPGWTLVRDRGYIALMKRLDGAAKRRRACAPASCATSRAKARPELTDIHIVRGPADIDPRMPRFVVAFLEHAWRTMNARSCPTRQR